MVVLDEITLRTPDALMSGIATEKLIENCCPEITSAAQLLTCDVPALLRQIKIATSGLKMDINFTCPKCSAKDNYEIDLEIAGRSISAKNWFTPLDLGALKVYFSPSTYREFSDFAVADFRFKKQLHQLTQLKSTDGYEEIAMTLLEQQKALTLAFEEKRIEKIIIGRKVINDRTHISEWFNQLEIKTQQLISNYINEANKQCGLTDITITCDECGNMLTLPIDLDACSQFRHRLISCSEAEIVDIIQGMSKEIKSVSANLLRLVWFMRGGITYDQSFHLTLHERETINKIVSENMDISKKAGFPVF